MKVGHKRESYSCGFERLDALQESSVRSPDYARPKIDQVRRPVHHDPRGGSRPFRVRRRRPGADPLAAPPSL